MPLSLLVNLIGIIVAVLVHSLIGLLIVLVGLFMLIAPSIESRR